MIVYLFDKVLTQEAAVDVLLPGGWALHLYQHISYINALSYINIHMLSYQRTGVFFFFSSCLTSQTSFFFLSYLDICRCFLRYLNVQMYFFIILKSKKLFCTTIQRMKNWSHISFQQILKASAILLSVQRRQPES